MRANTASWRLLLVVLVAAVGLLVACGGPQATEPPAEAQPTTPPTEVPQEAEPTVPPTEVPQEEEPTVPPTEVPQEEEPPAGDGAALLEERCTECHSLDRTTSKQKTREEWEKTVVRMVDRGAQLNEEEQAILIAYLAETYGP